MTELELHNVALVRAVAAERQMMHHQHHQRPPPAVVPAFYPPNLVPAGGQTRSASPPPFAVIPDRCGPALLPAQSAGLPVCRSVAPTSSDFNSPTATAGPESRENRSSVDVGGRIPVPDSKTRPALTGSGLTTPVKRHANSFSIDSLLGRQGSNEKLSLGTLEVRKSVADRVLVDAGAKLEGTRQATFHRPTAGQGLVSPACFANAPVPRVVPGCTARPELVTWF